MDWYIKKGEQAYSYLFSVNFMFLTDLMHFQVTAVTFNDTAEQVISGGIDNDMKVRNITKVCLVKYLFIYLFISFYIDLHIIVTH